MENVTIPKIEEGRYTEKDEKRMNIIGQNGNDGIHYDQIPDHLDVNNIDNEKPNESLENKEKEVIIEEEVKPISAKESIRVKQQNKLASQKLVYRSNR